MATLLRRLLPQRADTVITLGDYVNRGPDTKGVLDQLLALADSCRLIPLLGNHEVMLLRARDNPQLYAKWLDSGGSATLASYGPARDIQRIPAAHWAFIDGHPEILRNRHALFMPWQLPAARADRQAAVQGRALALAARQRAPAHESGKIAIVGHTPQADGKILDLGYLKCIDTGCCRGGWLTALDVDSGHVWQANEQGELREDRS